MTLVIGVDMGIRKIAAAAWHDRVSNDLVWTGAYTAEGTSRGTDLRLCASWLCDVVKQQTSVLHHGEELYVFIELPLIGNNRKYSMAIAEMHGSVLSHIAPLSRNVFGVNVSEWKKQVIGKGNATKDDVVNHISVVNSSYSAICGYDQDRYDAAAVGLYGVLVVARADIIAPRSS